MHRRTFLKWLGASGALVAMKPEILLAEEEIDAAWIWAISGSDMVEGTRVCKGRPNSGWVYEICKCPTNNREERNKNEPFFGVTMGDTKYSEYVKVLIREGKTPAQ